MLGTSRRLVLRDLSLSTRIALAAFLISVGVGYFSALVQLHFQHAAPGKLLPESEDAAAVYHGRTGASQMERLLTSDGGKAFNGSGSMRQAFTTKSAGWRSAVSRRAKENNLEPLAAEHEVRKERDGERLALLAWVRAGAEREPYENNSFVATGALAIHPISPEFVDCGPDGTMRVKLASIMEVRCARCHSESVSSSAAKFPLDNWEEVYDYCQADTTDNGMSIKKLAQTTHVHLLGFAMLYGMTGLIVTLTSYPGWMRAPLGMLPLAAQVVDISFWWLGRTDPAFARAIVFTGGIVATSLFLQISLSLFNLFGTSGKAFLVALLIAGGLGGYVLKEKVIDPHLAREKITAVVGD